MSISRRKISEWKKLPFVWAEEYGFFVPRFLRINSCRSLSRSSRRFLRCSVRKCCCKVSTNLVQILPKSNPIICIQILPSNSVNLNPDALSVLVFCGRNFYRFISWNDHIVELVALILFLEITFASSFRARWFRRAYKKLVSFLCGRFYEIFTNRWSKQTVLRFQSRQFFVNRSEI